jgi:hypothetical protein
VLTRSATLRIVALRRRLMDGRGLLDASGSQQSFADRLGREQKLGLGQPPAAFLAPLGVGHVVGVDRVRRTGDRLTLLFLDL